MPARCEARRRVGVYWSLSARQCLMRELRRIERVADDARKRRDLIGLAQDRELRLALENLGIAGGQHARQIRPALLDRAREREAVHVARQHHVGEYRIRKL